MNRLLTSTWFRLFVSGALIFLLFKRLDGSSVWETVRGCNWAMCGAAMVPFVLNRLMSAWKWKMLLRSKGVKGRYWELLRLIWISNFFGHFLPTTAGSDGVRVVGFARHSGRSVEAASSTLMDRATGAMGLVFFALLGALWVLVFWGRPELSYVTAAPVLLAVLLAGLFWLPFTGRFVGRGIEKFHWLPGQAWIQKAFESLHAYRSDRRVLLKVLLLSLIIQFSRVFPVYFTARALDLNIPLGVCFAVVPSIFLLSMIPISVGGWGIREGAFVSLFKLAGYGAGHGLGLALVWKLLAMVIDIPGLLFYLVRNVRGDLEAGTLSRKKERVPVMETVS